MGKTLYQKVWDAHTVDTLSDGRTQLFIGTHLIHEVTSPQAFGMLRELGLKVKYPKRTFATIDHIELTFSFSVGRLLIIRKCRRTVTHVPEQQGARYPSIISVM